MKLNYIKLFALLLISGCVQNPNEIVQEDLFDVKINNVLIADTDFIADITKRYTLEITTKDKVDIDDGKQITVSISKGNLASTENLASTSPTPQINVKIIGNKATLYYVPDSEANDDCLLSIAIDDLSEVEQFTLSPSEPDTLILSLSSLAPSLDDEIKMDLLVDKFSGQSSDKLKIYFDAIPVLASDSIQINIQPSYYSFSKFDENTGFVTTSATLSVNNPGEITIRAYYIKANGETIESVTKTVEFLQ